MTLGTKVGLSKVKRHDCYGPPLRERTETLEAETSMPILGPRISGQMTLPPTVPERRLLRQVESVKAKKPASSP